VAIDPIVLRDAIMSERGCLRCPLCNGDGYVGKDIAKRVAYAMPALIPPAAREAPTNPEIVADDDGDGGAL
jgi:hypothetical protein